MASSERFVTLRHGDVVSWPVVERLLDLETRGATFELVGTKQIRVHPAEVLTDDDVTFLRAHRDELRRVVECVDRICEERPA